MESLSIIIPAYNEKTRIFPTPSALDDFFSKENFLYEIIIVNDGSVDQTIEVTEKYQKDNGSFNLKVVSLPMKMGSLRCFSF